MGDRGNIVVRDRGKKDVYLYTHWSGYRVAHDAQDALKAHPDRWNDAPYLARIAFDRMKGDDVTGEGGFGISTELQDNEYPIVRLDSEHKRVEFTTEGDAIGPSWSFADYVKLTEEEIQEAFDKAR